MNNTLHHLFRYKAWANDQLLTALDRCDETSSIAVLAIKALSHTYVVDRIFAAHSRREPHSYTSANLGEMPTLTDLSADLRRSDQEYIDYVSTLDCDQLAECIDFMFTDGAPGRMSREEMLVHVVTHGAGHRGQVSAVMLLNSVAPAKDGFATYLHEVEPSIRRRAMQVTRERRESWKARVGPSEDIPSVDSKTRSGHESRLWPAKK